MKRAMVNNWNRFFCIRLHSPCANSFFHMNLHLHFFEGRGRYYLTWHCVFCLIGFGQFERRSSARCQHVVRTVNQCLESSHLPALSVPTHLIWLVFLLASRSVAWLPFVYACMNVNVYVCVYVYVYARTCVCVLCMCVCACSVGSHRLSKASMGQFKKRSR